LNREFPALASRADHDAIIIPETFLYNDASVKVSFLKASNMLPYIVLTRSVKYVKIGITDKNKK
jgi:hypothetical protein